MFRRIAIFFFLFPSFAFADLDQATQAYNNDDFDRAISLAQDVLGSPDPGEDALYAQELIKLSEYYQGRRGTAFLTELLALEPELEDLYGRDGIERLDFLFAISDLQFTLGQLGASTETDVQIARLALLSSDSYEDALFALRNVAIAYEELDPSNALYYAALFEFYATQITGTHTPWSIEATGMMSLALFRSGLEARAAQRFLLYAIEDWEDFANTGPDEAALVESLFDAFDTMDIPDEQAWFAEIQAEIDRVDETETFFAEASALLDAGISPLDPAYLKVFDAYLGVASPEDPIAAIAATFVMRNALDIGDFDRARPYMSLILSYPTPFIAVLDLPIGFSAAIASARGGVEDAIFEPLVEKAMDMERIVRSDNPELLFDLSVALAEVQQRQGLDDYAYDAYQLAIDLANRDGRSQEYSEFGRALRGAADALTALKRYDEAQSVLSQLRDYGEQIGDTDAVNSAIGSLALVAQAVGDNEQALALAQQRLAAEESRLSRDAVGLQNAQLNLATVLLNQSEDITEQTVDAVSAALSAPGQSALAEETQSALLATIAQKLSATPDVIAKHRVFRSAEPIQLAGLVTALATAAIDEGNVEAAEAWVSYGADLAADGSEEALQLAEVSGRILLNNGDPGNALRYFRTVTDNRLRPAVRRLDGATDHVPYHLSAAFALAIDPVNGADLRFHNEMFLMAQLANTTSAGGALNAALARDGADAPVARLLRERDAIARQIEQTNTAIARAQYDGKSPAGIIERRDELGETYAALSSEITERAPDLNRVTSDAPFRMEDVADRLREDEVLAVFVTSDAVLPDGSAASFLVAVSKEDVLVTQIPSKEALASLGAKLRCSAALTDPNCSDEGVAATRGSFSITLTPQTSGPAFDTSVAHEAYQMLISPMAEMLEGRKRLIIVPDQTLLSLPFHLTLRNPADPGQSLGAADWLIRDVSVEIAPTVRGFVTLRDQADSDTSRSSFFGVGDPLIGTQKRGPVPFECQEPAELLLASAAPASLQRSSGAERITLISDMSALPDARCELTEIAARFDDSFVLLHEDATETEVKRLSEIGALRDFSVLSFATHGLVAGEIGVNDSGLVMTPPRLPTAQDDGLLTTAEIASLDLDADFVVLSACNTASGDSQSDEGLSGMASAFFLAGAESLLVSHWPVYSDAAVALTTSTFDALRNTPGTPRAEALRQSMLAILDDPNSDPRQLHPAYWGAFMIVGDGLGQSS